MKIHGFSKEEKLEYLDKVIIDLKKESYKSVSNKEIIDRFKKYGVFLKSTEFSKLHIRQSLIQHNITPTNLSAEEKQFYFKQLLQELIDQGADILTNSELIKKMYDNYKVKISEIEIPRLEFRKLLDENNIYTTKSKNHVKDIIDKTIINILENENEIEIEINNVSQFHKYAEQFGNVSRGSIDNNIDYIQQKIDIKNIKSTKRIEAQEMSDEEIIIIAAKYYTKKNVYRITAAEIRSFTNSRFRTVNIEVIREYASFLKEKYDIELVGQNTSIDENIKQNVDEIVAFLRETKRRYNVSELDNIDKVNDIDDSFIVNKSLETDLTKQWELYLNDYIIWLAESRINVKNGLLSESNELKIDTEKKKLLTLTHTDLDIKKMNFSDIVLLTQIKNKASHKAYGVHMQNMYIGFLLFLHAKNKIIFPFSYVFDVCYSERKVQSELPYYLSDNSINKNLMDSIQENRLSIKDDKYKRIFQFFLLSLPRNFSVKKIEYKHLVPLLNRNKNDFKRVSEILNTLGANVVDEKPRFKYVDRYIKYTKIEKYKKLVEIFNQAMNRVYKSGGYSKEKSVYKNWSSSYADFFDFLESNYQNETFSESFLYKIFDYLDEENILTYQEYIQNLKVSQNTKARKLTPLIVAFSGDCPYKSLGKLKDNNPVFYNTSEKNDTLKKRGAIKSFVALAKIEDILRNRPPKSEYYKKLNIDSKYTDWWEHYNVVVPFEPLILLMHLYIPARGINFRLADRNTFLVKNESGNISGYHFTHDKNKKRKTPYIAPNIWGDDLKIIEDFVEYTKVHFPNQKAIKYDKQNPNGIVPLFPNAKGTSFYTEGQHMSYWKRVLLKAQIELNSEGNTENIILIYSKKSDLELPKESSEVDNLSQAYMDNFDVRYDLHSLRHTGATRYANAGMPLGLLKLLTGHIDLNVLQLVYIEIDTDKMIRVWNELQDIDLGGLGLADAGSKLINHIKKVTNKMLQENNPEQLLEFLKQGKFLTIGSYLSKDELTLYTMEDISKIEAVFWRFPRGGICTSSSCPQGLEMRCSLCPHFITSPAYMHEIAALINLQSEKLCKHINRVIENRENGNQENNESIRISAQIDLEEMLGWGKLIQALDEIRVVDDNEQNIETPSTSVGTGITQEALYRRAPIVNSDHFLLKLVYDGLALKQFDHESMQDASQALITKLIRYAARNGKFSEIDGKDKYEMLEWFKPVYNEVLLLEKDAYSQEKLSNILSLLSDKAVIDSLECSSTKQLTYKEDE
ncbi:site-specific integrase [Candidatus Sulfurimonas baltica]|uniref:Site-specific integrase n=1 Tax=Candidatus Sulfurimonas baltica TaxID=2740404 RepID=A0A7S7LUR8_9BACT|nr:site-specific integrase [Candidatus Sulfurimonas baltica]QOY51697.1 site-specific integrase [Candidatus Sulfurimonas baltica]